MGNEKSNDNYTMIEVKLPEQDMLKLEQFCAESNITIEEYVTELLKWIRNHPKEFFKFAKENRTDKCNVGTIGYPLFNYEDEVGLYVKPYQSESEIFCKGKIYIIDAYGTMDQNIEPSYDVMVENFNNSGRPCLCKHVRESELYTMQFTD